MEVMKKLPYGTTQYTYFLIRNILSIIPINFYKQIVQILRNVNFKLL